MHHTGIDIRNGKIDETFVPSMRTSRVYLYEQAHVNTTYEVAVWAETGGGEGVKRSVVVSTWPLMDPGAPDMVIDVLDSHSIRVTWVPSEVALSGTGFYLNYTLAGSNVWTRTDIQRLPDTHYHLGDLRPEHEYYVSVVSVDGDHSAASPLRLFRTRHAPSRRVSTGRYIIWIIYIILI